MTNTTLIHTNTNTQNNTITLYPSNWLYNAGVIGLLNVLKRSEKKIEDWIQDDGTIKGDISDLLYKVEIKGIDFKIPLLAKNWLLESWDRLRKKSATNEAEKIKEVWGKIFNVQYRGFFNANTKYLFEQSKDSQPLIIQFGKFINSLLNNNHEEKRCSFCLNQSGFTYKNIFTSEHSKLLGASAGEKGVPNSFWNLNSEQSLSICDFCSFVLLNHHLALTDLPDDSQIFINAPSFQVMWHLNQFAQKMYGSVSGKESRDKREILAMSIIEYATRIQTTLGKWAGMNIEIVSKKYDEVNYFSIPHTTVQILSDPQIATLLSDIGEFRILNMVLNQEYGKLLDTGYKLLRIGSKDQQSKTDKEFIKDYFYLPINKININETAYKICQLHALIEEKIKKYKL